MADASDEQRWWSTLFAGEVDPGLAIPDGIWESLVANVFDGDTGPPGDDLIPDEPLDLSMDAALDDDVDFGHHVADQPLHGDAAPDQGHQVDAHHEYHSGSAHELEDGLEDGVAPHDVALGDIAFGDDDIGHEME